MNHHFINFTGARKVPAVLTLILGIVLLGSLVSKEHDRALVGEELYLTQIGGGGSFRLHLYGTVVSNVVDPVKKPYLVHVLRDVPAGPDEVRVYVKHTPHADSLLDLTGYVSDAQVGQLRKLVPAERLQRITFLAAGRESVFWQIRVLHERAEHQFARVARENASR